MFKLTRKTTRHLIFGLSAALIVGAPAFARTPPSDDGAPSSSLMANGAATIQTDDAAEPQHALQRTSMFAVVPPEPRSFDRHDLIQIIVRESSRAKSKHELETGKEYELDGAVTSFPSLDLANLIDLELRRGDASNFPIKAGVQFTKDFNGEGDYKREDDLTARLTAEVIEVLPNGNLVLEARTHIKNDEETLTILVTGICRPDDVTDANTVLSNQIHDLHIDKTHAGELRNTTQKGIIARVLDAVFAF